MKLSAIFTRPLSQLTAADINQVCVDGLSEGADLELKRTLPGKDGARDPWFNGQATIGAYAKEALTKEIVAFANAHGGVLLVGVCETDDQPHRAERIEPLPRCADLAGRLRQALNDLIEPKLAVLEIEGIPVEADGSGVIVLRVPASRLAPHRDTRSKECFIRRADRSEPLTMREIQDLTLTIERGLSSVIETLDHRFDVFRDWSTRVVAKDLKLAMRVSVYPVTPLQLKRVHGWQEAQPEHFVLEKHGYDEPTMLRRGGPAFGQWRANLGGTWREYENGRRRFRFELNRSGLLEASLWVEAFEGHAGLLPMSWYLELFASALISAEKLRCAANSPATEMAVETFLRNCEVSRIVPLGGRGVDAWGQLPIDVYRFPRMSLGERSELGILSNEVMRDLLNAASVDHETDHGIDFEAVFRDLGLG